MSSRNTRRALKRMGTETGVSPDDFMRLTVATMAARGPELIARLDEAVGSPHRPGHAIDAAMNAAAQMERAALANDGKEFLVHAAAVLFLIRDIAIAEKKIVVASQPQDFN